MKRGGTLCGAAVSALSLVGGCRTAAEVVTPRTSPGPALASSKDAGDPPREAPPVAGLRLATGGIYNCVVQSGRVYCWGLDRNHPPGRAFEIEGIDDAVEVAAGYEAACARRATGEVVCWNEQAKWTIEGVSAAISIAVGQVFACAAEPESVKCWRSRLEGEEPPMAKEVYGVEDPIQVAAGFYHACALERGGAVTCWGMDPYGALGSAGGRTPTFDQGAANDHDWVAQIIDSRGAQLELDAFWDRASRFEPELLRCVGAIGGANEPRAIELELRVDAQGDVTDVRLSRSDFGVHATEALNRCLTKAYFDAPPMRPAEGRPTTVGMTVVFQSRSRALMQAHPVTKDAVALASRGYFSCAVSANGALECWGITHGFDGAGIHGTRLESPGRANVLEGVSGLETISIGWRHACGRREDGSHVCFGGNGEGTFGPGVPASTEFSIRDVDADGHYTEISAGPTLSCGIRTDGSVWCWGINDGGRLGIGHEQGEVHPPAPVVGLPDPA
jgi:alpha-tubulin suppressor-like RCC1 family protein